ncbi:MAG: hypothetical protein WCO63_07695 [Bacteroidota bacterium]
MKNQQPKKNVSRISLGLFVILTLSALQVRAQTNSIKVYVSPPADNTSNVIVTNPQTLTSMSFSTTGADWAAAPPTGTNISNLGKYFKISGTSSVIGDNDYGAGTGSYLGISETAKVGLKLNEDKNYFGFAWCAGDVGNQIQVYHNGQLLLTYTTADVMTFLPKSPNQVITATNASTYNSSDYYGKFTSKGTNNNEPYAYLHIYSTGSIVFDSLVFTQDTPGSVIGTFETDNHSVVSGTLAALPGSWAKVYEATAGTAASDQSVCSGNTPSDLSLSGSSGTIQWQVSSDGNTWSGISGATSTPLTSVQIGALSASRYYRAAVTSGSSTAYSNVITITVPHYTPAVKTLADVVVSGTGIKWYNQSSGGSLLPASTVIVDGTHYYASQTTNGCESTTRFVVIGVLDLTPPPPTGSSSQSHNAGETVAFLQATGTNIKWYATSSGGTALNPATTYLVAGTHYFASQTINCSESASRLDVTVTLLYQ